MLEQENSDLLRRLTAVQQEKWTLEEKVSVLIADLRIHYAI